MKVKFKEWSCIAQGSYYGNGRRAIILIDAEDGEPIATASVNMVNIVNLPNDQVYIKNYSENEGMTKALVKADIIEQPAINGGPSGYVMVWSYKLTDKALKELWKE